MSLNCAISVKKDKQGFCNTIINGKLRVKQTARIEKTLAVEENLEVYKDVNVHGSIDSKEITTDDLTVNNQLIAENIEVKCLTADKIGATTINTVDLYATGTALFGGGSILIDGNNHIINSTEDLTITTGNPGSSALSIDSSTQDVIIYNNLDVTGLTADTIGATRLRLDKTVYPKLEAYDTSSSILTTVSLNKYLPFFGFTATKNTNTTNGFTASTGTGLQNSFIYTGTTASTFNIKYSISLRENSSTGAIYQTVLLKNGLTASPYFSSFCKHTMTTTNTTKLFHGSAYINLSPNDFIDVRILNSGSAGQITIFSYSLSAHDMNLSQ